jgi:ketosteroid isomerase-like protein
MSTSDRAGVTVDDLLHFLDCWNRHDIDGILGTLTDDCLYITGDGARLSGLEETRAGLTRFLETYPDAHWHSDTHFVAGSRGASEWIMTATGPDGAKFEIDSCDLFEFRDGKISRVSAYRRARPE